VDTHPCLRDRLQAIGYIQSDMTDIQIPTISKISAAQNFLGNSQTHLTKEVSQLWHQSILPNWQERYQYVKKSHQGIIELQQKAQDNGLSADEIIQLACWKAEFTETSNGIEILENGLKEYPKRADFYYILGMMQLDNSAENSAIENLKIAMDLDFNYIAQVCERLHLSLQITDNKQLAEEYSEIINLYCNSLVAAQQERRNLHEKDDF
jgi:lipopolysaccharide biosynthesis regulator YciM